MNIPLSIQKLILDESYDTDQVGMSNSSVLIFPDKVLKIQEEGEESEHEYEMMKWLKEKIPVPDILAFEKKDGKDYLLMSKIEGEMACSEVCLSRPNELITLLAKGMELLWQVDIRGCPYVTNLDKKLEMAEYNVVHNLVDINQAESDTFTKHFQSPAHLLDWLKENKPLEEPVLSHGDYCLPNIILKDGRVSGFIDLGKAGLADKWQDIALCYRSLCHNRDGLYGGAKYADISPGMLFKQLKTEPDWDKLRYYILLDELL